jgi:RNA polymerase sigma-70 factor (ECF subfamily)
LAKRDEAGLLAAARRGEREALAELCARWYPRVLRYMRYRVRADAAEDLTSEVFVRVVRGIGGQTGSFRAWLFAIARNVVTDWLRHKQVAGQVTTDGEAVARQKAATATPAEATARRLDLAAAIEQLTEAQRELVTLKFLEGFDNAEIATLTGRSPEAIRVLQFRALRALRRILGDEGHDDEHDA